MTLKPPRIRSEAIYVSRSVLNDLRALALSYSKGEELQTISPDEIADDLLRKALDAIPGIRERAKAIRKAIDEVTEKMPLELI